MGFLNKYHFFLNALSASPSPRPPSRRARGAMINFVLMMNKQGKIRLSKFYVAMSQADQTRVIRQAFVRSPASQDAIRP